MHALILGGNGFIGSHLVSEVLRHGHQVRVFDRHPEQYRQPVAGVEYVIGDFLNRRDVSQALDGIDVAYHLVASTLPQTSNSDPAFDISTNVIASIALFEECLVRGVKKVVYVSSGGTVYGVPQELPVTEDAPNSPICSYGITRLCIEKYLELFRHLHGLDYVVLRPSNAYGPRQDPRSVQGVIGVFLARMLAGSGIRIWGDGSVVRDYIYVEDLAEGIYVASTVASKHHLFNLGSGHGMALKDLVALLQRVVGRHTPIEYVPGRAFDVPAIYLDVTRATQELGWRPRTPLEAGIASTIEFLKAESLNGVGLETVQR